MVCDIIVDGHLVNGSCGGGHPGADAGAFEGRACRGGASIDLSVGGDDDLAILRVLNLNIRQAEDGEESWLPGVSLSRSPVCMSRRMGARRQRACRLGSSWTGLRRTNRCGNLSRAHADDEDVGDDEAG